MLRPLLAMAIVALTAFSLPAPAHGATPKPKVTTASRNRISTALDRKIRLRPGSSNRRFPATGCQSRAATMPASTGTLGPNGASASQTLVAVPIGGGDSTASATRRAQLAEACAHVRH